MSTILVTGSGRCGSSLTMRMLDACKVPILHSPKIIKPNIHNPHGFYEHERVFNFPLGRISKILDNSDGKAIKILPPETIFLLPKDKHYKTIFLQRNIYEVAKSNYKIELDSIGRPFKGSELEFIEQFIPDMMKTLTEVKQMINNSLNFSVLYIDHKTLMTNPIIECENICNFLSTDFPQYSYNPKKMAQLVDPELYRNRWP